MNAIADAFASQARACHKLGSPFTGWLCEQLPDLLSPQTELGRRIFEWPGDPAVFADNLPLRLCGGLHSLALSAKAADLANLYRQPSGDEHARSIVEAALQAHSGELMATLESPPQTNEVARATLIYPALRLIAAKTELPIALLEVGASAGLNLNLDRFAYKLAGQDFGDPSSPLCLAPEWHGGPPGGTEPAILQRRGCDLRPIDIADPNQRLRLLSYVWADQPERMARQKAAIEIALAHPYRLDPADAVDWLEAQLPARRTNIVTVIYSTIAWQYLPKSRQRAGAELIEREAARVDAPLAWVRFEADGKEPGAMLRLDLWPNGPHRVIARGDFHGRWVDWQGCS